MDSPPPPTAEEPDTTSLSNKTNIQCNKNMVLVCFTHNMHSMQNAKKEKRLFQKYSRYHARHKLSCMPVGKIVANNKI